jgi:hypothetical protein
MSVASMSLVTR